MIETDVEKLRKEMWEQEDVEHVEEALRELHDRNPGLLALPGLEHVRNKIAVRVGMEAFEEGHFKEES